MSRTPRVSPATGRASRVVAAPGPARHRSRSLVVMAFVGLALLLAACSSKGYGTSASSTTTTSGDGAASAYGAAASTTTTPASGAKTDVSVATTSLGPVLVDSAGLTLYTYAKDTGTTATCTGACAKAWPAAMASGTPTSSTDVTAKITVSDSGQLLVGGHPVYTYAADKAAGDVNGQGVGGVWYAVQANGQQAA